GAQRKGAPARYGRGGVWQVARAHADQRVLAHMPDATARRDVANDPRTAADVIIEENSAISARTCQSSCCVWRISARSERPGATPVSHGDNRGAGEPPKQKIVYAPHRCGGR